jgi:hypothetical protein
MTVSQPSPARELAQQLIAREAIDLSEPAMAGAALQRLLSRVSGNLRRSVGDDGCSALFERAFLRAEPEHPALRDMIRVDGGAMYFDRVVASLDDHDPSSVSAAVESLLAEVVDILSGIIGADMVLNLLDHDTAPARSSGRNTS